MFKSIFSKYYTVVVVVVLSSFIALCGTQTFFSSRYWSSEKEDTLCRTAVTVADYATAYTERSGNRYTVTESFRTLFNFLAQTDANMGQVLIVDLTGTVCMSSTDTVPLNSVLSEDLTTQLRAGCTAVSPWFTKGTLGGLYAEGQYTAAAAICFEQTPVAYVLVSAPMQSLMTYLSSNLQVFMLSAMTVLAITFAAMYISTYRLVRPLRQMAAATRQFAEGDFSYRLKVNGKDEVAQLAAALNSMAVSLSSVEDMRRSFVSNVSHELKTPMTTIAGFIDGILDGTIPPEKHDYYLKIVSDEVKRLSRLVKSMLDLSRIDSGQLSLNKTAFDLTAVACNVLLSFEQRIDEKQVTVEGLDTADRAPAFGDHDLIGQVVYNLVDNATKFINQNGVLTIGVAARGDRVYFRIRNTGTGISAPEMPHIFERFYKTDQSRGLDKKGVGLGLYIVKNVIGLHGSEISVRSAEGEYCEFEFWLPAAETPDLPSA